VINLSNYYALFMLSVDEKNDNNNDNVSNKIRKLSTCLAISFFIRLQRIVV
jgi:hypothetical protein